MPDLNSSIAPGTQLTAGDPEYQKQVFQGQQRLLAPQYAQAVQRARQNSQNRGLYNSGLGQQEEQQVGQEYRQQTNANAGAAATGAADVAEQNRRQQVANALQLQMQGNAFGQQDKILQAQQEQQNRQQWSNLLGGVAGAAGGVGGGLLARTLFPSGSVT